jgi:N-acetylglucosamine kinase-like BadF-type ATPase
MAPIAAIGVDLGGSWLRLRAVDARGKSLFSVRAPSVSLDGLPRFCQQLWRKRRLPKIAALGVASRGVWWPAERKALAARLAPLARRVTVFSDVEGAWLAAFGQDVQAQGILVASGTGSIALARDADGCFARAGGLGPLLGDEGSAFWIGREWIRARRDTPSGKKLLRRLRTHPQPVRAIAQETEKVYRAAAAGHPKARRILRGAQEALATLAADLSTRLHWNRTIPISWAGGLLEKNSFRKGWMRAVASLPSRKGWRWTPPRNDTATATALHMLR